MANRYLKSGGKIHNGLIAVFSGFLLIALLSGCAASAQPKKNSTLTHGNVQMKLKKGITTQTDVLEAFGSPNITSTDASGNEVWTYQRSAQEVAASSSSNYWTAILFGGNSRSSGLESSSSMITLIIKFDSNGVVKDFRSRTSNF
ncbi:hypothetical protein CI610_03411 [invertebrate metagenome]|uniref:Lipoprotein SmpA/OmlA domain-containing protein n=1 Tax=invertebrate metagenome TaxID=1711999 RepID=A0A2H9T394_9ZZZZ